LQRRGVLAGRPPPLPAARCQATPLAGVDVVKSPVPGLIVHACPLGSVVAAGDTVAEIVDPTAADPLRSRTVLTSRANGRLFARAHERLARPGQVIAKIAGATVLPDRTGNLLEP
jgi:predicted deacylase